MKQRQQRQQRRLQTYNRQKHSSGCAYWHSMGSEHRALARVIAGVGARESSFEPIELRDRGDVVKQLSSPARGKSYAGGSVVSFAGSLSFVAVALSILASIEGRPAPKSSAFTSK